jgi:hypothetical protein
VTVAAHHDNRPHGSGCRFPVIVPIVFHARWWTGHAMGEGGVDGHREVGGGVLEARAGEAGFPELDTANMTSAATAACQALGRRTARLVLACLAG